MIDIDFDTVETDDCTDMQENCIACKKVIWYNDDHLCKSCGRSVKNEEIYKMIIIDLLRSL